MSRALSEQVDMWAHDASGVPTTGSWVLVQGDHLGNSSSDGIHLQVQKFGTGLMQPSFSNHSHAAFRLPAGRGQTRATLTVAGQAHQFTYRYAAPRVLAVAPSTDVLTAGQTLQVTVRGLGGDPSPAVKLLPLPSAAAPAALGSQDIDCQVDSSAYIVNASALDTQLSCVVQAGAGSGFGVRVTVHDTDLTQSSAGCDDCNACARSKAQCQSACLDELASCRAVCMQASPACLVWGEDCATGGAEAQCDVQCQSANAACMGPCSCTSACSSCSSVDFAVPRIMSVNPSNMSTSGRDTNGGPVLVTIRGTNFGPPTGPHEANIILHTENGDKHIIPSARIDTSTRGDTVIRFVASEASGASFFVSLQSPRQAAALPARIVVNPPRVRTVTRLGKSPGECATSQVCEQVNSLYAPYFNSTGQLAGSALRFCRQQPGTCYPTSGGFQVVVLGESFGAAATRRTVRIGGFACQVRDDTLAALGLDPHTHIVCEVGAGVGQRLPVAVVVGGRASDPTADDVHFAFDPPSVKSVMPNTPDAAGDEIVIRGSNFGMWQTPVAITVHGVPCAVSEWLNNAALKCVMAEHIAGPKNVSVLAANRTEPVVFHDWEMRVLSECKAGSAGLWGESCIDCAAEARGSNCPGGETVFDLVTALPGFWRSNVSTPDARCHADRQGRTQCPVFKPCEPSWACLGENTCEVGYEGDRCAFCLRGEYYRINGVCQRCPDRPWLIIVGFMIAIMVGSCLSYWLNKKDANIAFITIGVDYFQVLAMLARARVRWPAAVMQLYNILSAFNFNLELAAPECSVPDISTEQKFLLSIALPAGTVVLLGVHVLAGYLYNRAILQTGSSGAWGHANSTIAAGTVAFYFLYMYITRVSLDVFNCAPTDPPDGNLYMAGRTDIVCFESPVHRFMIPFAAATAVVYVAGFPSFILWHLRRNKMLVVCDQVRRSFQMTWRNTKNDTREEKRGYAFRKRWQRLYFLFRPERAHYWIVVILLRKLAVAFSSLMFTTTPVFQMAASLLVMFVAFVAQARNAPYLGANERKDTADMHQLRVRMGDSLALLAEDGMNSARAMAAKRTHGTSLQSAADAGLADAKGIGAALLSLLLDYNNAESVLLGCAVLVNLFGIMFLSSRFSGEMLQYHQQEYDALAYGTLLVIAASVVYFFVLLSLELLVMLSPATAQACVASCVCSERAVKRIASRTRRGASVPAATEATYSATTMAVHSNPFLSMAVAKRAALVTGDTPTEAGSLPSMLEKLDPDALPTAAEWARFCASASASAAILKGLRAQLNDATRELQDVKTSRQMRSNTKTRTEFTPSRLGTGDDEQSAGASMKASQRLSHTSSSCSSSAAQRQQQLAAMGPTSNPLLRRPSQGGRQPMRPKTRSPSVQLKFANGAGAAAASTK